MMTRILALCSVLSLLVCCWGCAVCASPYDCTFGAYGGIRERMDMVHGRVGSVIDPAPEVSHVVPSEQSPEMPEEADDEPDTVDFGDESGSSEDLGPLRNDELELPDVPDDEGSIELPELEVDEQALPQAGLSKPRNLHAKRHPLHDLFNEHHPLHDLFKE